MTPANSFDRGVCMDRRDRVEGMVTRRGQRRGDEERAPETRATAFTSEGRRMGANAVPEVKRPAA